MTSRQILILPRFQKALIAHAAELNSMTYWRYVNGYLPPFVHFLAERPHLAEALAEDLLAARKPGKPGDDRSKPTGKPESPIDPSPLV